jgi:ubiquinone/menaquinone biosynthesis C-methylase UbiE
MGPAAKLALVSGAVVGGAALWWRKNPSACPYSQRFWVEAPHPFITRARLREVLEPKPGERVLEVGPGTGYYSLPVAGWLSPGGRLDVLDLQQEMLDHTLRRAADEGIENIEAARADAREMPYPDHSFDAAFLVTVLGEIPDQAAALRELQRVVKPGGRIVVGELFGDPHMVTHQALRDRASEAGLSVERKLGGALWHFTRLQPI